LARLQEIADGLDTQPFESIELVGLVSNMCVLANAVIARTACPNTPIIVDAACTAAPDPAMNEKALDIMEGLQIEVVNRTSQAEKAEEGAAEEAEDDAAAESGE
jgi:nicotinamidase-related amidase